MSILATHFGDRMDAFERRLARGAVAAEVFGGVDDELFALILGKHYEGWPAIRAALPDYPDVSWVQDCTGNLTLFDAVKEAVLFWKLAKDSYSRFGRRGPLERATVVDYGAGWGRITRFCPKDVGKIYAIEPNPVFHDIYRETRVPAELVESDFHSAQRLPVSEVDLLFCFSILTHASDALARNIAARWAEMMAPGGVVQFTIRPGSYLQESGGEIDRLSEKEKAACRKAYAAGRLAYWPYEPTTSVDWGITVAPMAYLREIFGKHFEIIGPRYFLQNHTQLPIIMVRR
jgi:hypothetical protein